MDKVPHTLLFEGLRGTGKTTLARIISVAANCESPVNGDPCLTCEQCLNSEKNLLEIDAGSNRGVENIEELHDVLRLRPLKAKRRTVIIDECHMLTEKAANAALKLFEEPPDHITLVLCTTGQTNNPETKIAKAFQTLVSRCMRFQFSAVDVTDIYTKLQYICQREDREVENDVLRGIARKSHGSVRDAESLLDSALTFSDAPVVMVNDVRWLISAEEDKALELLESLCSVRPFESILLVKKFYDEGYNMPTIARSCVELATEALQINLGQDSFLPDSQKERLSKTAKMVDITYLLDIIRSLGQIKSSPFSDGKQDLEIVLADLAYSVSSQPSAAW
tara:strand:- start:4757 stop:5764 length:1008 start_codon:yes stop_codon:yes gene_type:complete